jgi:hypothetical protein
MEGQRSSWIAAPRFYAWRRGCGVTWGRETGAAGSRPVTSRLGGNVLRVGFVWVDLETGMSQLKVDPQIGLDAVEP